jgi:hypothetical protein
LKVSIIVLILFVLTFLSCGRLDPQPKEVQELEGLSGFTTYVLDKDAGGLFEQKPTWYTYYAIEQQILSNLDIYSIRAKGRHYKMQIVEAYPLDALDDQTKLGQYRLRLDDGTGTRTVDFNASACGTGKPGAVNPCIGSAKDVFTYLSLSDGRSWQMTDALAKGSSEWDIAFKLEKIKLNSGKSGPGNVAGALLSRDSRYFATNGVLAILEARAGGSDLERFNNRYDLSRQFYYGPDGINRVIFEDFWFVENNLGTRSALAENWWIVRHFNNEGYSKFSVSYIDDDKNSAESTITFFFHTQEKDDATFPLLPTSLTLKVKASARKIYCLDLNDDVRVVNCREGKNQWDLRFINNKNQWSIETQNGARGPLSQDVVVGITRG